MSRMNLRFLVCIPEWMVVLFLETENTGGRRDFRQKIKGSKSLDLLSFRCLRDSWMEILCWLLHIQVRSSEDSSHQHIDSTWSHGSGWLKKWYRLHQWDQNLSNIFYGSSMAVSLWENSFAKSLLYWLSEYSQSLTGTLNCLLSPTHDPSIRVTLDIIATPSLVSVLFLGFPSASAPSKYSPATNLAVKKVWEDGDNHLTQLQGGATFFLKFLDLCSTHGSSVGSGWQIAQEMNSTGGPTKGNALNWTMILV